VPAGCDILYPGYRGMADVGEATLSGIQWTRSGNMSKGEIGKRGLKAPFP
jgi:hypothetical protein